MEKRKMNLNWSKSADNYSKIVDDELDSFRPPRWEEKILSNAPEGSRGQLKVLDCGCGPGFFSIILSKAGCRVTGIDGSVEMLSIAAEKASLHGTAPVFMEMDCQQTDFGDNSFDLIVSRNVTHALVYHRDTYREWLRILRPGGVLLIFDANWHLTRRGGPLREEASRRRLECLKRYGDDFSPKKTGKDEEGSRPGEDSGPSPHVLGELMRPDWDMGLLEGVGFSDVSCERDITGQLWDDKERLIFGATPMFMIRAVKPAGGTM